MSSLKKQVTLCTVGTMLEWYDFSLFACLAPIISLIFFPKTEHFAALMSTFVIFASGYIMRPIGALFFGHLGDTLGRKSTLLITIFLMALATTAIGIIPLGSPISTIALVICRLAQGFASSGEYPGGVTLLAEQSQQKYKAFVISFGVFATGAGTFIGMLICFIVIQCLGDKTMLQWGWRIPFLLSAPLGLFGFLLRKTILESSEFQTIKQTHSVKRMPLLTLIKNHYRVLFATLSFYILTNVMIYINLLYFGSYAMSLHKITTSQLMYLNLIVTFVYSLSILLFGFLSDRINKIKLMMTAYLLVISLAYPLFIFILHGNLFSQFFGQAILSFLVGMILGPLSSVAVYAFPTNIRYSGMSLTLNIPGSIFGGTAPIVCIWLTQIFHNPAAPAFYIIFAAILSVVAGLFITRQDNTCAVPTYI